MRSADDGPADREVVDYLAGYAEALADAQPRRKPGVVTDD
jgi:hypothetical protein